MRPTRMMLKLATLAAAFLLCWEVAPAQSYPVVSLDGCTPCSSLGSSGRLERACMACLLDPWQKRVHAWVPSLYATTLQRLPLREAGLSNQVSAQGSGMLLWVLCAFACLPAACAPSGGRCDRGGGGGAHGINC